MSTRLMHLNGFMLYCPSPVTRMSWVYPEHKIRNQWWEMAYWEEIVRTLEAGCFDALFLADNVGSYGQDPHAIKIGQHFPVLDPVVLTPRLAATTEHLGFVVTMSSTFYPPYLLARTMQSLDHVTEGRVAWNIVTSVNPHEGANVGIELPAHDERYQRAHEYMDAVYALWDSIEPDAVVMDHEQRMHTDPDKVHPVNFDGEWYRTAGPLCVMPGPQGRPVLAQAGSSDAGRTFAATHAEMIFVAPAADDRLRATIDDLRSRASDLGRDPYDLKIVLTYGPIVGETNEAAKETQAEILARPGYEADVVSLSHSAGFDLRDLPPTTRVSEILDRVTGMRGPWEDAAATDDPTLEEFGARFQNAAAHDRFVGTAAEVADALEEQMEIADCDGFQFSPTYYAPDYFRHIVGRLVPELQRRGRVRTAYSGSTLRDRLSDR